MNEDLTTKARLRDAAIAIVAEGGAAALTARGVAERAGVSQGLIRHHFGSMADLLAACDDRIADLVKRGKETAIKGPGGMDALAAVRATGADHVMGYLAMRLGDDSPRVAELVDLLISDAEGYISEGVAAGMMRPTDDEPARAAMLTIYALGSLALHTHLRRHFDLDVRATDVSAEPGFARYVKVQMEVFGALMEPSILSQYEAVLTQLEED